MGDGSRSEKPTPRRLEKAREEGRFPVSREFVGGVQFAVFISLLAAYGPECFSGLQMLMRESLLQAFRSELNAAGLMALLPELVLPNISTFGIIAGLLVLATVATQLVVTQLGVAPSLLMPDLKRLNPLNKVKSLPKQNVPMLVQAVVLLPVFGFAVWGIVQMHIDEFLMLPLASVPAGASRVTAALQTLLWRCVLLFLILGAIDLFRQRRRYMNDLKMSVQEIREEHKQLEGNPQLKAQIRRIQRDLLRRNMMKEIPKAAAVVVNPTHYAVAIKYSLEAAGAPTVIAKGKNYLALRIKQRAIDHNVPIVENAPLAQALYKSVDLGQEIPPALYKAVAEVLAYIFRLTQGGKR